MMKYKNDWHLLKKEEVLSALTTDMYKGLSDKEAGRRRKKYGANTIWRVKRVSALEAVCQSLFDVATLLLVISAAAAALFDKDKEALAVTAILIIGGILRAVVFVRASRILENMAEGLIPVASVIRDGQVKLLPAGEIVPGDIIFLEPGCTVPCDGRVLSNEDSVVSERNITENAAPVHKFDMVIETEAESGEVPCEYRSNMLFAGSTVLSGTLRIAATSCGTRSLIGMKQGGITVEPSDKLPLIEKLRDWCKFTSLVMLAFVMILTVLSLFLQRGYTLPDIFLGTMAMAVAAMSEYLLVIGYIIIAAAIHRCARPSADGPEYKKLQSFTAIRKSSETENIAKVGRIVFCGSSFFESGEAEIYAYRVNGTFHAHGSLPPTDTALEEMISLALPASAAGRFGMSLSNGSVGQMSERACTVQTAAEVYSHKVGADKFANTNFAVVDHVDSSNVFAAGLDTSLLMRDGEMQAVSCGEISAVLRSCSEYQTLNGPLPFDAETRRQIFTECASLEYIGAKIVAVARTRSEYATLNRLAVITQNMTFVGFFAIAEQPEKHVAENISFMRRSSIVPILLSSDAERDLYYCHDIGLMGKKTKIVPYSEFDSSDLNGLTSYGMIVSFPDMPHGIPASAKAGAMRKIMAVETDARTAAVGREISDADVLRQANVGFAVAQSAYRPVSEPLSREATAVVNPASKTGHGGLDGVIKSLCTANQAVRNIKSSAFYLTAAQVARLVVLLAAVLCGIPLLNEVVILVWGLLFDFAAILVMAFETGDSDAKSPINREKDVPSGRFIPISISKAAICGGAWGASAALTVILTRLVVPLFGQKFTEQQSAVLLVGTLIFTGLVTSCEIMKRKSLFQKMRINYAFFGFALCSLILAPLVMLTGFGASWVGGKPCGGYAAFSLVSPAITLVVWETIKKSKNKQKNQNMLN